jgi:plasmid stability protein
MGEETSPLNCSSPGGDDFTGECDPSMQNCSKKGLYLHLHNQVMHRLRQAAVRHHWTVAAEATRILEATLQPGHVGENAASDTAGTEKCNANGLYVDLSEELLVLLRPLAERNYRSVAGEAAFVLETVLGLAESAIPRASARGDGGEGQGRITATSKAKLKLRFRKKGAPGPP